ncbi:sensor histidine kinase [Sinanaerobacter chloroacetimidivorans]|jgi:two-component system sensor histidine kinase VicK|uniref:histidine kinase n=1 Tax=Sinanaerobacter chloroacetimidivorans TaxID=2818044 RepID=A0A8J7W366_9FIRM|nr:ATP-binding protein [Sinanaerobacter chloroacetimidivorans]MBR0598323.1 PAS domain S-box protein [Sinanaerobacter chloroacetimidivorans]
MFGKKRWSSIRWKIVFIYFLLVFIATTIIGVFIMNQLESYYKDSITSNITKMVHESTLLSSLNEYDDLKSHQEEIQTNVQSWYGGVLQEIFVVDSDFTIIASNNESLVMKGAVTSLNQTLILRGLNGEKAEADGIITNNKNIPVKNMVFPIGEDDDIKGVLYLREDMSSVYDTIDQSKVIFVRAMAIALVITVVLGFFIARSITVPINDVTEKAERMAQGDFTQEVSVKSDDEIGRLAEMFNLLRKQLDLTLSEISSEKSKLETILRYMADGLIAVDLSGHIIHANPAAMQMLGISDEDMEKRRYDDIIKGYNEELQLEKLRENSKDGGAEDIFFYRGSTFAVRYDRFKDESGQDIGIIMILQDITERQKLENMQMDFVANVSHELKTPLTTIKSYTETLLSGDVEDKELTRNFLSIVDAEADRMNRLVKDLLQLSRLDYKQEKWYKKDSNLISLLKSAVTKVELTAKNKNQHLNCIFDDSQRIMVVIDKDGIEQVLLNILSNAIKYTQEGGRIDIDAFRVGKYARIIIADNGIGIPEKELSRVFERFFRVDRARSRAMGGTGLGLSISKQIVEDHNGNIELESKEGKGTKVTISLPLAPIRGRQNIE